MITAPIIDNWIDILFRHGEVCFDEKTETLIKELFGITESIADMGDDHRKEFWITAPRGSFEDYSKMYHPEDYTIEELQEMFEQEYPREKKWYHFVSVYHHNTADKETFYGVFLANKYILNINDPNARSWPMDTSELVMWLIEKAKETIELLKCGTYNQYVKDELPYENKYGTISRKDFWDIYPELREEFHSNFQNGEIEQFLKYAENFEEESKPGYHPDVCLTGITARDYYETCGIAYKAVEYEYKKSHSFNESEKERERYGGITPKEMYYCIADGRDDGMKNVPMDDPDAFEEWLNKKGEYYEFNGSHPWEIRTSASIRYSIHLYISSVKDTDSKQWYYSLSGDEYWTSIETIKMYVALKKAGLPVILHNGVKIAERVLEKDMIGILPETYPAYYAKYGCSMFDYKILDHINLPDDEKASEIINKADWLEQKEVRLKK